MGGLTRKERNAEDAETHGEENEEKINAEAQRTRRTQRRENEEKRKRREEKTKRRENEEKRKRREEKTKRRENEEGAEGAEGRREEGKNKMRENDLSERIIGCAIEVHRQLGPGLLESVYEEVVCYELSQAGLRFKRQEAVPLKYKQVLLPTRLRLDLIVEGKVIVDNKAKSDVVPIDEQKLLTYLRLRDVHLGLLINVNVCKLVDGVHRVVNQLRE